MCEVMETMTNAGNAPDERAVYSPPCVVKISDLNRGEGQGQVCNPTGSGNSFGCNGGNSPVGAGCTEDGNSADLFCLQNGNTAGGFCTDGAGFT
jgi:hypothetical protein